MLISGRQSNISHGRRKKVIELQEQLSWKTKIREYAESLGFVKIRFTEARPLTDLADYLEKCEGAGYSTPFVETSIALRTNPKAVWQRCQTVGVLAYSLPLTSKPKKGEGVIARSAVGEDYHRVVRSRMEELVQKIVKGGWSSEPPRFQVDTGSLNERGFAIRSGLGWAGRNQQLIIPGVGSFAALALILFDQELPTDKPLANQCGTCQKCIQACPAQLLGEKPFAADQCLSYLTQSKESLTEKQGKSIGHRLFGCDSCQEACPHNKMHLRQEEELEAKSDERSVRQDRNGLESGRICRGVDLMEMLTLTKPRFNERFRNTAAGWRGKGILQRNAYQVMENLQDERRISWLKENKDNETLPLVLRKELMKFYEDR